MITDIENLKHSNTHKDTVFNDKEFNIIKNEFENETALSLWLAGAWRHKKPMISWQGAFSLNPVRLMVS